MWERNLGCVGLGQSQELFELFRLGKWQDSRLFLWWFVSGNVLNYLFERICHMWGYGDAIIPGQLDPSLGYLNILKRPSPLKASPQTLSICLKHALRHKNRIPILKLPTTPQRLPQRPNPIKLTNHSNKPLPNNNLIYFNYILRLHTLQFIQIND